MGNFYNSHPFSICLTWTVPSSSVYFLLTFYFPLLAVWQSRSIEVQPFDPVSTTSLERRPWVTITFEARRRSAASLGRLGGQVCSSKRTLTSGNTLTFYNWLMARKTMPGQGGGSRWEIIASPAIRYPLESDSVFPQRPSPSRSAT